MLPICNKRSCSLPIAWMGLLASWLVKDLLHHQLEEVNVGREVAEAGHQACLEVDEVRVNVSQGEGHA